MRFGIIVGFLCLGMLLVLWPEKREHVQKTVLEMQMSPIDNQPGDYILEYSNGQAELLRADGTRSRLTPVQDGFRLAE